MNPQNDGTQDPTNMSGMPPAAGPGMPPQPQAGQDMPQQTPPTGDQGMGGQGGSMPSEGGQDSSGMPTNEPTTPGEQQPEEDPTKNEGM